MTAIDLVVASLSWLSLQNAHTLDMRAAVAAAIISTDANGTESVILMRLAFTESHYSHRVARCVQGTTAGGRGTFQVIPRVRAGYVASCSTIEAQAVLALTRVRESLEACAHLPLRDRLAVYARGSCKSSSGRALSRYRMIGVQ